MARRASKRRRGHREHENEDRWLLTYADMITLLMALFMVLFAISSVNTSKFESLQKSLADAFSGRILGGEAIKDSGGSVQQSQSNDAAQEQTLTPMQSSSPAAQTE